MPQWDPSGSGMGPSFQYDQPDFTVRAISDGDIADGEFQVRRECLERGSSVFGDMFACCDSGYVLDSLDENSRTLDIMESPANLDMLFRFLHYPPPPYVKDKNARERSLAVGNESPDSSGSTHIPPTFPSNSISKPGAIIPFPLLQPLFHLADKYSFSAELTACLHSHLAAYAPVYPLRVYGHAVQLGLHSLAAETSTYLLHPPLSSYSVQDLKAIPTAEAYHRLLLLHDFRRKKLREILSGEEIFPHGYGACPRHGQKTVTLWERKKADVVNLIEAATDVAGEMGRIQEALVHCEVCTRACTAALSMLAYKCAKVPKRIDKISM